MRSLAIILLLILCSGCCMVPRMNPLYEPSKNVNQTIMPEYKKYVDADPQLDEKQKRYRKANAEAFEILIREYGK
jgi:predicted lipoprotein